MCSASYWDQNVFCKLFGPKCVLQVIKTKMCSASQIIKSNLWLMQRMKAQIMLSIYYQVQICWYKTKLMIAVNMQDGQGQHALHCSKVTFVMR